MTEKLKRLKESLEKSLVVKKGDYDYFVHPLTDGVPVIEPELLEEVAQAIYDIIKRNKNENIDKIVTIEAMGIPIGAALSLKTGIPFNIIRKKSYGLKREVSVQQITGYSKSELYINGINKGDRVLLVDDVYSTGGTINAVVKALQEIGAEIVDTIVIVMKSDKKADIKSLCNVDIVDGKVIVKE